MIMDWRGDHGSTRTTQNPLKISVMALMAKIFFTCGANERGFAFGAVSDSPGSASRGTLIPFGSERGRDREGWMVTMWGAHTPGLSPKPPATELNGAFIGFDWRDRGLCGDSNLNIAHCSQFSLASPREW